MGAKIEEKDWRQKEANTALNHCLGIYVGSG